MNCCVNLQLFVFILAEKNILKREEGPAPVLPQIPVPGLKYEDPFGKFRLAIVQINTYFVLKLLLYFQWQLCLQAHRVQLDQTLTQGSWEGNPQVGKLCGIIFMNIVIVLLFFFHKGRD